jgi:hypothetical protein
VSDETPPPTPAPLVPVPKPAARYEICPHCGNSTILEPSAVLGVRCGICGKARVPVDLPGFERSNAEVPALARASASHTAALAWTAGSAVLALFSAIGLAALGLVYSALNPGFIPLLFGILIALLPGGFAGYGLRRAAQLRTRIAPALEEGWLQVVREIADAEGSISDVRLAKILDVDRERAEQLLAQLAATSSLRHRLDPAPLAFESPKLRVDADAKATGADASKADEAQADADERDLEALEAAEKKASRESRA